jgi:hypothetical protein
VVAALVLSLVLAASWNDEYLSRLWPYPALIIGCIVQTWRPTTLGWAVIFAAFASYSVVVLVAPARLSIGEYLVFTVLGPVPSILLFMSRPKLNRSRWTS